MNTLDQQVREILTKAEAESEWGLSSRTTGDEIIRAMSPFYKSGTQAEKKLIIARIEKLKKEPGCRFPDDLVQELEK